MRCNRWAWFRHSSAQFFNISFCVAFLLPILLSTFSSVFAAFYEIFHNFPLTISLNFDVFSKLQLCVTNAEQIVSVPNRESRKDRARTLTAEWKLLLPVEMGFGMRRLRHVSANFLAKLFLDGARRKGVAIENWIGSIRWSYSELATMFVTEDWEHRIDLFYRVPLKLQNAWKSATIQKT